MPEESLVATARAEALRKEIYEQLEEINASEFSLARGYIKFGKLLLGFKQQEWWRELGYNDFNAFISELCERSQRGRTQIYSYLSVTERLLPVIDADILEEIGISKALEFKNALKAGKPLPPEIIEKARERTTTAKEVRGMLGEAFNLPEGEKGTWFDLGGTYFTAEERTEFKNAVAMTKTLLNIGNDIPEHIQRKEVIQAWLMEFVGTHAAEVYGFES